MHNPLTVTADFHFEQLPLARPFAIARGTRTTIEVVRVSILHGEHRVISEATPTPRYQQTRDRVAADLEEWLPPMRSRLLQGMPVQQVRDWLNAGLYAGSARNALDCALWQLETMLTGTSLEQLVAASLDEPAIVSDHLETVQTIGIDTPYNMAIQAEQHLANGIDLLKIKLDGRLTKERMIAIRGAVPSARLVADANEAFTPASLTDTLDMLSRLGVLMVEQPLPTGQDDMLAAYQGDLPLCADESLHTSADIASVKKWGYRMINIKLDKCGGLTEAIRLVSAARQQGLRIMLGCMLGSSLAMRPALPIAARAEFIDLDGPTWLAQDSQPELGIKAGIIMCS